MKNGLLAIFVSLSMMGCDENSVFQNSGQEALLRKWDFLESTGGIGGVIVTQNGNSKSISFESNGTFTQYQNGQVSEKTTYRLEKEYSIINGKEDFLIKYGDDQLFKQSFRLSGDTLFLYDEVYDGFTHVYLESQKPLQD